MQSIKMGHKTKIIFCIFLCLVMFNNVLGKKKKKQSSSEEDSKSSSEEQVTTTTTESSETYPVGIHCTTNPLMRFWDQPDATRKCCKHAKVACKHYVKQDHEETNCIVTNNKEKKKVIKCCKHRDMTWDHGYNSGKECDWKADKNKKGPTLW